MGGSSWSDDDYYTRSSSRAANNDPVFQHTANVKAGKAATVLHPQMNPFGVKVRESRDSDAHPESNPIAVVLDETGSMGSVIGSIQASLPKLMGLLIRKNYIHDPQVMFCAIGDAEGTSEQAPLQVGQFESGLEMEDDMSRIFIEGNGQGNDHESYQNAIYFLTRHTSCDAWEKRGKRGYIFIIGDEMCHALKADQVKRLIGDDLQENIALENLFEEAKQRWNIFFILPKHASHGGNRTFIQHWQRLVGPENVLEIEDASAVAELIASQIGMCEGAADENSVVKDMVDIGVSSSTAMVVARATSKAYNGGALAKVPAGTLAPSSASSGAKRL